MNTSLTFLADLPIYEHEKPYELWLPPDEVPEGLPLTNCVFEQRDNIVIKDMRSVDSSLETTGFTIKEDVSITDLDEHDMDDESKVDQYLQSTIRLAKKEYDASKVICFDWRFRTGEGIKVDSFKGDDTDRQKPLKPAKNVHMDDSYRGGLDIIRRYLTRDEHDAFEQNCYDILIINVWKPLVTQVDDHPLAVCDRRTVSADDLIEYDRVHSELVELPEFVELGQFLKYKPSQQWYWCSSQRQQELLFFVTWDSRGDDSSGVCHGAFRNPAPPPGCPVRASIEVRLIIMIEKDKM